MLLPLPPHHCCGVFSILVSRGTFTAVLHVDPDDLTRSAHALDSVRVVDRATRAAGY